MTDALEGVRFMGLIVPTEVEAIIDHIDDPALPLDERQVSAEHMRIRKDLSVTNEDERKGAFAEVAAWHFERSEDGAAEPWGLYWGPLASGVLADGATPFYSPNVADIDDDILVHWIHRSNSAKNSAVRARYADLAWTIGRYLKRPPDGRPECKALQASIAIDVSLAHSAIDHYLHAVEHDLAKDEYHTWFYLARAVGLAVSLKDAARIARGKSALFSYHQKLEKTKDRFMWWRLDQVVARFEKALNLDASETLLLVTGLKTVLDTRSDVTDEKLFDPHAATGAADRLVERLGNNRAEIQKVVRQAGHAFEKAAEKANGMLAVSWLEDLIPRYRDAGLDGDAVRVEQIIRARSGEALSEMKSITVPIELPEQEINDWAERIAGSSLTEALGRIAVAGMTREENVRKSVQANQIHAPLASRIAVVIMSSDGFTEATIGSVDEDILGRSFKEAAERFNFEAPFLYVVFNRVKEKHGLDIEKLLDHVRNSPFFPSYREPLLRGGLAAWFDGDPVKAIHVLVPLVEAACRDLLASAGVSVRRPNPRVNGSRVIGLGDVLASEVFKQGAMKDVGFHLRALYTDPRGINLRNKLAHGLAHEGILGMGVANLVVHSILLIAALNVEHKKPP
jgi:hypothetical protein